MNPYPCRPPIVTLNNPIQKPQLTMDTRDENRKAREKAERTNDGIEVRV